MNRPVAEGLMIEALKQRQVVVLSSTQRSAYGAFHEAEQVIRPIYPHAEFRRSSGNESIRFEYGGSIRFRSVNSRSLLGMVIDVAYLDLDRRELHDLYEAGGYHEIRHTLAKRANSELIVRD